MSDQLRDQIAAVVRSVLLETDYSHTTESADGDQWVFIDGTVDPNEVADAVIAALPELTPQSVWRVSMKETRPDYILAIRAQALDKVQELIEPYENDASPHPEAWARIVEAAFPPPPMAGGSSNDTPSEVH